MLEPWMNNYTYPRIDMLHHREDIDYVFLKECESVFGVK
jgi:hypothetical protein